mgnify:CR=1 FL=1
MRGKLHKILDLIDQLNEVKKLHCTGRKFYKKDDKYYQDSTCLVSITKEEIDKFNESEKINNNAERSLSFIIHK